MSLMNTMLIATSAMKSQAERLNLVASNLANADVSSATEEGAYKAKRPVFQEVLLGKTGGSTVMVRELTTVSKKPVLKYDPADPLANEQGMVWKPAVDVAAEMSDMITASRAYQLNAEVANMSRTLIHKALNIGT